MATASYICKFLGSHTRRVHAISPLNASKTVMYMPTKPSLLDSLHINRPTDACIKSSACTETLTACAQQPEGHDGGCYCSKLSVSKGLKWVQFRRQRFAHLMTRFRTCGTGGFHLSSLASSSQNTMGKPLWYGKRRTNALVYFVLHSIKDNESPRHGFLA